MNKKAIIIVLLPLAMMALLLLLKRYNSESIPSETSDVAAITDSIAVPSPTPSPRPAFAYDPTISVDTRRTGGIFRVTPSTPGIVTNRQPATATHRIHGRVTDPEGNGIPNVTISPAMTPEVPVKPITEGVTDADGRYLVEYSLNSGTVTLNFTPKGLPPGLLVYPVSSSVKVERDELAELNFVAEQGLALSGKIVGPEAGEFVKVRLNFRLQEFDVTPDATKLPSNYTTSVEEDGSFAATIPYWSEDSLITVTANLSGYTLYQKKLLLRDFPLTIPMIRRDELLLRVVYDDNDEPVTRFEYMFESDLRPGRFVAVDQNSNEITIKPDTPHVHTLRVRASRDGEHIQHLAMIDLSPFVWPEVVEARLKQPQPYRLRVYDAATKLPIQGAEGYIFTREVAVPTIESIKEFGDTSHPVVHSDEKGYLEIGSDHVALRAGVYMEGYIPRGVEVPTNHDSPFGIPLYRRGQIRVLLLDQDGNPKPNGRMLYTRRTDPYAHSTMYRQIEHGDTERGITTDDNGMFLLEDLAPGQYTFRDRNDGDHPRFPSVVVTLGSGETKEVVVGGTLRDLSLNVCINEERLTDGKIRVELLSRAEEGVERRIVLDADDSQPGRYHGRVPPGPAYLQVSPSIYTTLWSSRFEVSAQTEKTDIELLCLYSLDAEAILVFPDDSYSPDGYVDVVVNNIRRERVNVYGLSVKIGKLPKEPVVLRYRSADRQSAGESEEFIPTVGERVVVPIDIRPVSQ